MVIYCVVVLGFVATTPDVRLRCLMADYENPNSPRGVEIWSTPNLQCSGPQPKQGDLLVQFGEKPTPTFIDFTQQLIWLRNAPIPPGGSRYEKADPSELADAYELPFLLQIGNSQRWVEIKFIPQHSTEAVKSWLLVQSLPLSDIVISLIWFILQLGVFAVGALAYWHRPFDRSSRLFYSMCIATLGSFLGGYHWWIVAGSLWLLIPYIVCAVLVPVVSLHFFLVFPRPKPLIARYPRLTLVGLYTIPLVAISGILGILGYLSWLHGPTSSAKDVAEIVPMLQLLRLLIYTYFVVASVYFGMTLLVVRNSYTTTGNPLERSQLKWIWRAGMVAAVFVGLTLYLALFRRADFALGAGRIPMFLASLSFMVAYAVGIVRYKLMLVEQIVSKGMLYYVVSCFLTILFSATIAVGMLLSQVLNISPSPEQTLSVAVVLMLSVMLLLWLRDLFQQMIDRQFFREKYQLDKALQRMNRAVGRLVDPEALAEMMLSSCRDVLRVERAALYWRTSIQGPFQLVAADGAENVPLQFTPDRKFLDALKQVGSLQRVTPGSRHEMSPVQNSLHELHTDLVHALEVERGIVGLVMLGGKKNAPFTAEDLTFLNALGQITNVALHSAKVDQDVTRLNEELRLKIERIADQKRQLAILQAELSITLQSEPSTTNKHSNVVSTSNKFRREAIIGDSPAMQRVLKTVRKVAASESSVLIYGESGTGKELLAKSLHENSPRRSGPMTHVHCASLSPGLLESELFGHVKGAFTGAHRDKVGRFEMASGGTLFLDEIGDISLETQIKLLRVLQERCFEPVGGSRTIHVDVRLITATHQNLEQLIAQGRFREDLYYRLNVISVTLPPLRERREDILELAFYFLNRSAQRVGRRFTNIDQDALAALERHKWPGNIRELENAIERAVVLAEHEEISLHDLPAEFARPAARPLPSHVVETKPTVSVAAAPPSLQNAKDLDAADPTDDESERTLLVDVLHQCGGNKAKAARMLNMPRSTYFSKLKKYAIE